MRTTLGLAAAAVVAVNTLGLPATSVTSAAAVVVLSLDTAVEQERVEQERAPADAT